MDNTKDTVDIENTDSGVSVSADRAEEQESVGDNGASDSHRELKELKEEICRLRTEIAELNAEKQRQNVNKRNAESSIGRISGSGGEYFTADEVRSMSQSEVRANFKKIKASMPRW